MQFRFLAIVIFMFVPVFAVFSQTTDTLHLSIEEVIERLKADNLHIKASEYQVSRYENNRRAQKGLYMPSVDINAAYSMMSEPLELDLTPVRDAILPAYELIGGQSDLISNLTGYMASAGTMDAATYQSFADGLDQIEGGREQAMAAINDGEWVKTIQEKQFAVVDASITWPIYTGGKIRAGRFSSARREPGPDYCATHRNGWRCASVGR